MKRFYKYLIYRFYTWRLEKKDDTPGTAVEIGLCTVHIFQLFIVYLVVIFIFPSLHNKIRLTKLEIILGGITVQLLYHLFIYNRQRWLGYIEEFKDETPEQRKKGTLLVRLFTFGSIALFFILLVAFIIATTPVK